MKAIKSKKKNDIFQTIVRAVSYVFEEKGVITKDDLKYLPTKEDFYTETVKILKELEDLRIEKDMIVARSSDQSDKIEALEKIHPHGVHLALN